MSDSDKKLTKENLKFAMAEFIEKEKLAVKDAAKAIGCPTPVIGRILCGITWPSDETLKRSHTMMEIGYKDYKKLSDSQKEKISETIGAVGGAGLGVGVSIGAVSALGTVAGLSGPGIVSGLAALGTMVGGTGMLAGLATVAAIPALIGLGGYLAVKGIKSQISDSDLKREKYEPRWECPTEEIVESGQ